jgi:general stress protein YciG
MDDARSPQEENLQGGVSAIAQRHKSLAPGKRSLSLNVPHRTGPELRWIEASLEEQSFESPLRNPKNDLAGPGTNGFPDGCSSLKRSSPEEASMAKGNSTSNRGFASMDEARQREIASKGGRSVPAEKRSFSQDRELASEAGRKGGQASGGTRNAQD